jgi:diguanylate cyclase (GGDEF)-like protein/PAS domain S-box-containing protein
MLHTETPSANAQHDESADGPDRFAGDDAPATSEEIFEAQREQHLDADSLACALDSLLSRYPRAPVAALKAEGVSLPMPASIRLNGNPVLQARSGLDLVVHEDRVRLLATWDRVLATGAARCLARLASNPELTSTLYLLDLREEHGVILGLFAASDAPVAERSAAAAPAKQLPRFGSIVKDERSFIVEVDEAITQILGWSAQELVGHRSIEFIHTDDHALAIDNWMEMLASPGPSRRVRLRHRRHDGSWVWFEVTNHNLLDDPEHSRVTSEVVDISDEMAAQEELRAREQLLDRLAGAIPLGLFQVDAEHAIVYTNDRLHEILGVERVDTVEEQLRSVVDADKSLLEGALEHVLQGGSAADVEVAVQAGRELHFCAINLRPLSHEDGSVSGAIACVADVTDSARMREELSRRATFDELTGCYNRASIMRALEAEMTGPARQSGRAVMFLDLDRFKETNDRHGHAAGDELLRVVSERLRGAVREHDLVGRIGGDEFLVVCPDTGASDHAMRLAERVAQALHADVALPSGTIAPRVSIGVAWSEAEGSDPDLLVAQADAAMYRSKSGSSGRPTLAQEDFVSSPLPGEAGC